MRLNTGSRMLVVLLAILDVVRRISPICDRPDFVDRALVRLKEGTIQTGLEHQTAGPRIMGTGTRPPRRCVEPSGRSRPGASLHFPSPVSNPNENRCNWMVSRCSLRLGGCEYQILWPCLWFEKRK